MALAPKFAGQKFTAATSAPTLHTLELYLDYVCPFSLKMFNTVYTSVFPLIRQKYASNVQILFRQVSLLRFQIAVSLSEGSEPGSFTGELACGLSREHGSKAPDLSPLFQETFTLTR